MLALESPRVFQNLLLFSISSSLLDSLVPSGPQIMRPNFEPQSLKLSKATNSCNQPRRLDILCLRSREVRLEFN